MRRSILMLVAVSVGLLVSALFVFSRQAARLSEGVARDASELEARVVVLQTAPEDGSVFDCLGPEVDRSPDLSRVLPWTDPSIAAVISGAPLTEGQRAVLETNRPWLERALACGRKRTIAPTAGLGPFHDFLHGRRQSMPRLMETLSSLAPLVVREGLERGQVDEALERCTAVLVLTTGWLRLEGLESMLPTMGPSRAVLPACADALARSAQPAPFRARLAELGSLAPSYVEVMKLERTQLALRLFGAWVPPEVDAQLPASARLVTKTQRESKWQRGVLGTLALRLYWKRFEAGMREVEVASALEPAAREKAILAAQAKLDAPFLKRFFAADPVDLRYQMYAVYLDQLHASLSLFTR